MKVYLFLLVSLIGNPYGCFDHRDSSLVDYSAVTGGLTLAQASQITNNPYPIGPYYSICNTMLVTQWCLNYCGPLGFTYSATYS